MDQVPAGGPDQDTYLLFAALLDRLGWTNHDRPIARYAFLSGLGQKFQLRARGSGRPLVGWDLQDASQLVRIGCDKATGQYMAAACTAGETGCHRTATSPLDQHQGLSLCVQLFDRRFLQRRMWIVSIDVIAHVLVQVRAELFQALDSIPRNASSTKASDPSQLAPVSFPTLPSQTPAAFGA